MSILNYTILPTIAKSVIKSVDMPTYALDNGWFVKIIPIGAQSPVECHYLGSTIAADDVNKIFYVWRMWALNVGVDSIITSCNTHLEGQS